VCDDWGLLFAGRHVLQRALPTAVDPLHAETAQDQIQMHLRQSNL
jgi:hypothetical protein